MPNTKPPRELSRREFLSATGTLAVAAGLSAADNKAGHQRRNEASQVSLRWLDGQVPACALGTTWGTPWPSGLFREKTSFALHSASGGAIPMQSWPLAYWPDGSLKWTAHAIGVGVGLSNDLTLSEGTSVSPASTIAVRETAGYFEIDTQAIRCRLAKRGSVLLLSISRGDHEIARNGRLICLRQDAPDLGEDGALRAEAFEGTVDKILLEQSGPLRAVVKVEGRHVSAAGRAWLPFTLRLYFYAGAESVRLMHTFVFDGDEQKDFIRGLGLRFDVPMRDEPHDRHIRFAGEDKGLWAEAVRNLSGLRREPPASVVAAQLAGQACPFEGSSAGRMRAHLQLVPAFGDFSLVQPTADSFEIRKRTRAGFSWLSAAAGKRASGLGYVGGVSGGVGFGLRDFWQRHPTQLDVRGAAGEAAQVTLWMWSPEANAMDLRFYHDGLGQDSYAGQLEGLNVTYEDYEPGFATPLGIARTSELTLWALAGTPARERLVEMAEALRTPAALVCAPSTYLKANVFGSLWSLPDATTPAKKRIEDRLDWSIAYYQTQIEQRHWYGFWHYGDVMHTYDPSRHVWRYDVGGFAWDNSELSPDLWLWYAFLRTGRADVFRMAEAMTRHTGEVDVYHLGPMAGLGSRHNVMHWGDSAKQLRISTAAYRRIYYYLTADERVGDLLHELLDSDRAVLKVDPVRKVSPLTPGTNPYPARMSFGTDWTSVAAAWLTEWERTRDTRYRDKLVNGMQSIAAMPRGYFQGSGGYDPATGKFVNIQGDRVNVSHLSAVFGAVEIYAELLQLLNVPEFERAWLEYCELYNASPEQQQAALGQRLSRNSLRQSHSRLTAYAARRKNDPELAKRAWSEFLAISDRRGARPDTLDTVRVEGPAVLNPIDEAAWVSTNDTAQWCLAAMQNLALVGDHIPQE